MTFNDSETSAKRYTLRPTFTPLPQAKGPQKNKVADSKTNARATALRSDANSAPDLPNSVIRAANSAPDLPNSVIRAANEDDDLYDPYSDYHDGTLKAAEFEKDPWR